MQLQEGHNLDEDLQRKNPRQQTEEREKRRTWFFRCERVWLAVGMNNPATQKLNLGLKQWTVISTLVCMDYGVWTFNGASFGKGNYHNNHVWVSLWLV